jgi:hypothetical protein
VQYDNLVIEWEYELYGNLVASSPDRRCGGYAGEYRFGDTYSPGVGNGSGECEFGDVQHFCRYGVDQPDGGTFGIAQRRRRIHTDFAAGSRSPGDCYRAKLHHHNPGVEREYYLHGNVISSRAGRRRCSDTNQYRLFDPDLSSVGDCPDECDVCNLQYFHWFHFSESDRSLGGFAEQQRGVHSDFAASSSGSGDDHSIDLHGNSAERQREYYLSGNAFEGCAGKRSHGHALE